MVLMVVDYLSLVKKYFSRQVKLIIFIEHVSLILNPFCAINVQIDVISHDSKDFTD